ncbi:MAG: alpha-L-arabinofuranosidase, partial [Bifidobacterium dentium]
LIYFDNERVYLPYSYWVQRMYATTTADTAWPVAVEGPTTLRRDLPNTVRLLIDGNAKADLKDLTVTTASGKRIELGDVHYYARRIDTGLDLSADDYSIDATVVYYEGRWGMQLIRGDVDGKNHNIVSLGRGHSVQVVRDGTGYALAGTEVSMNEVRPGTTWQVHIEISDRGQSMKLYIDGTLIADGTEVKDEPRRTVTVSRNAKAGETYVRVVNAMDEPVDVDLSQILAGLDVSAQSAATATAAILAGNDPYAGDIGKASPTKPVEAAVDLTDGAYLAPAWSFSIITIK